MATNSGIKKGKRLAIDEMRSIIDQLFACKNPNYSPHGQLIYYILGLESIEEFFKN